MRLLVVEDEENLRTVIRKRLTKEGYSVDACGDGQEALARMCFDCLNWQSPDTWVDEQFYFGEWVRCERCGRVYDAGDNEACPHCGGGAA